MTGDGRARGCGVWVAAAVAALSGGTASAAVLYDTTTMVDTGTYSMAGLAANSLWSYIGNGIANGGVPLSDIQSCDDFSVSGETAITSVTADFVTATTTPMVAPRTGVLVEFFPNLTNAPSNEPYQVAPGQPAQFFADSSMFTTTNFTHNGTGSNNLTGLRITVDLAAAGITLGAGSWWMSVVPVDETAQGITYRNVSRAGTLGGFAHRRGGGTYHGNTYGTAGASTVWTTAAGNVFRDLSFRVEGHSIPSPTGATMIGVAGILTMARRRRAH